MSDALGFATVLILSGFAVLLIALAVTGMRNPDLFDSLSWKQRAAVLVVTFAGVGFFFWVISGLALV